MGYSNTFYDGFCAGLEFARLQTREGKASKYARWTPLYNGESRVGARCSNCGWTQVDAVRTPLDYMPFCPNCKTKMIVRAIDW